MFKKGYYFKKANYGNIRKSIALSTSVLQIRELGEAIKMKTTQIL